MATTADQPYNIFAESLQDTFNVMSYFFNRCFFDDLVLFWSCSEQEVLRSLFKGVARSVMIRFWFDFVLHIFDRLCILTDSDPTTKNLSISEEFILGTIVQYGVSPQVSPRISNPICLDPVKQADKLQQGSGHRSA